MQTDSRKLFLLALDGAKTARPPFWIMRQAGRYLPEYRALKEKHGFVGIVQNPELAVEAALQPMRRFDFDCSILFSDILVISEALGIPYHFKDAGGIAVENPVRSLADVENLAPEGAVRERLQYVAENLKILRAQLPNKGLLGFCGSPFTLAGYMVEGEGSKGGFPVFKSFAKENPPAFRALMERLTRALCEYASMQIECGIDAFQIFDSNAALTDESLYMEQSGKWIEKIAAHVGGRAKTILYAKGMGGRFGEIIQTRADAYGLDSSASLSKTRSARKGSYALQGNVDESLLSSARPEDVKAATLKVIGEMRPFGGHVLNLGHGILPDAKIENVEAFCAAAIESSL